MAEARTVRPEGLAAYTAVTGAYWAFMLTDGALRMLVLLHFNRLGFTPIQLAYLFLLYEIAGIVTNLSAGWIAARFGLTSTLYAGLALQIGALLALAQLDPSWAVGASVVFVMAVQGVSGVAKDLAKMSSKSAVKILAPADQQGALFRWVALLTGSKNAVKGFGFLLGAALLALAASRPQCLRMAAALIAILVARRGLHARRACRGGERARSSPRCSPRTAGSTGCRPRACSCSAPATSGSSSGSRSTSTRSSPTAPRTAAGLPSSSSGRSWRSGSSATAPCRPRRRGSSMRPPGPCRRSSGSPGSGWASWR